MAICGVLAMAASKVTVILTISFSLTSSSVYAMLAVGASVSTIISLLSPRELASPGAGKVRTRAFPASSYIVPLFNARAFTFFTSRSADV